MTPQPSPPEVTEEEVRTAQDHLLGVRSNLKAMGSTGPLADADAISIVLTGRAQDKQCIRELEAALREASTEVHRLTEHGVRLGMISPYDQPWEDCPREPCRSDRALLAPPTKEVQGG